MGGLSYSKPRELRSLFFVSGRQLQAVLACLPETKNPPAAEFGIAGGERGIRTLDTLLRYTHFPGVLLKPLGHLSNAANLQTIHRIAVAHYFLLPNAEHPLPFLLLHLISEQYKRGRQVHCVFREKEQAQDRVHRFPEPDAEHALW